jgi:predicted nucleic acid-binding protein
LSFDRAASVRRLKPQRAGAQLSRRGDANLPFVEAPVLAGPELLLDTCVYLDVLQAKVPPEVEALLTIRTLNHSDVALAELTHRFGRLDPKHSGTRNALREIGGAIDDIPGHRLTAPSTRAYGEAGMLAGMVARLTGGTHDVALLNDALLFLQARESGRALLTANVSDFDYFDQLLPGSGLLLYRTI